MPRKKELRQDYKKVLSNLNNRWIQAASHNVCKEIGRIIDKDIHHKIEHLLCFSAFFPGEVDLTNLISDQLSLRKVYLPILHSDGKMNFISIDANWQAEANTSAFGIAEPAESSGKKYAVDDASATVVIVPGLVFDRTGNRLGRGKGYYDRFLASRKNTHLIKIGVCWEMQLLDDVPSESHDVPMDWVCHERGSIKTGITFEDDA